MADSISYSPEFDPTLYEQQAQDDVAVSASYLRRSPYTPAAFILPAVLGGLSWLGGGVPMLTDLSFLFLTVACCFFLLEELWNFPKRFGLGGCIVFGGVLIWFCYDYMTHWFRADFQYSVVTAATVSKAAFFHAVFVLMMTVGLLLPGGKWIRRRLYALDLGPNQKLVLFVAAVMVMIGFATYFVFGAKSIPETILSIVTLQGGRGLGWTVGRTGNLNYSWGGYATHLLEIALFGAILGVTYTLLYRTSIVTKVFFWFTWLHYFLVAFYTSRRGPVLAAVLPILIILFIKYNALAAERQKSFSLRALVYSGLGLILLVFIVQTQIAHRGSGFADIDFDKVSVTELQGNSMFSEGLDAWAAIPDSMPFFANRFPGDGALRALPETAFWFLLHPVPRALWNDKPVDAAWAFRAHTDVRGREHQGTTVSTGLVGWWFVRYGAGGVLQGGVLFGWLIVVFERALQNAGGRILVLFMALAALTELLRMYRDFVFLGPWSLFIGYVVMWVLCRLVPRRR